MKSLRKLVLLVGAFGCVVRPAGADIVVRFVPENSVIGPGETVMVDVVADIDSVNPIVGWGLDVTFDGGIVGHASPGDVMLGSIWSAAFNPDGDGLAGVLPFGFPPAPPVFGDDIVLATLSFEGMGFGVSSLNAGFDMLDLTEGFAVFGGGSVGVSFEAGSIAVVPVPGAAVLGVIGFFSLAATRRRGDRARQPG